MNVTNIWWDNNGKPTTEDDVYLLRTRTLLLAILAIILSGDPAASQGTSADARLRAMYTAEWQWRQQEMARVSDAPGDAGAADHHPRVDAASQARRYAYWQRTLAALDSIPLGQLSPEERINAQVFSTSIRALATCCSRR